MYSLRIAISLTILLGAAAAADARSRTDARTVREWILQYHAEGSRFESTNGYAVSYFDLNGDGSDEALVYLRSRRGCGTGGCNLYVLTSRQGRWKRVSGHTVVNLPVRVLPTRNRGWRDIAVSVRIGASTVYQAALEFDGSSYPLNPSMPPARRLKPNSSGVVLIDSDTPLQPLVR